MTEEEKYTEKYIRDLIRETEFKHAPSELNERIMKEIHLLDSQKKTSPLIIPTAWVLLFLAVALLPFLLKLLLTYLLNFEVGGNPINSVLANNFYFFFLSLLAASLLLIAERLIKISFTRKTGLNI